MFNPRFPVELGQSESIPAHLISEVRHVGLAVHLEDVRIADHLGIPAVLGHIDASLGVIARPVHEVRARCIADPVSVFPAAIVSAKSIAEEHVILAVAEKNVRACLRFIGLDPAFDEVAIQLCPVNAVVG